MGKSTSKSKAKSKSTIRTDLGRFPVMRWLETPSEHDFPSAGSFLKLVTGDAEIDVITALLSQAPTVHHPAKDILRAARLPLLPIHDPEVRKDLGRVRDGVALSPILLVRGDIDSGRALVIADGYHRACTSYHLSEDIEIPCRIATLPPVGG